MGWNHVLYFFIFILCSSICYLDSFLYQVDYRREVVSEVYSHNMGRT